MKDTLLDDQLKEEQWGYFRPGYYPMQSRSVVPAMVCLTDFPYSNNSDEPNVQFVLVKANCYLKAWQDALLVSEQDFQVARTKLKVDHDTLNVETLMAEFMANGYMPLNKVKVDVKLDKLH